jgi:hypothetical protein
MPETIRNPSETIPQETPLKITNGIAMLYYCFDIGYEIQLKGLERIRGKRTKETFLSFTRLTPPYIQYKVPPLLIRLGKRKIEIDGREFISSVDVKVYDFGVITIRFIVPISGNLTQLYELASLLTESRVLRKKAISEFLKIRADIIQAVVKPRQGAENDLEDYAIFMVQEFDRKTNATYLLENYGVELARILRGERNLSAVRIQEALKNPLSYYDNDLTTIDWNAAFIYDPEASYDVPDVIEFALIQLLELRLYDQILDTIVEDAYDAIEPIKFRIFPFSKALRNLSQLKLDISEIVDRLEKHLKLIGDIYLAKVYETAAKRFYLEHWNSAVRHKLVTIESIYNESWSKMQTNRMIVLEMAIVLLFIIDIILIVIEFFK